MNIEVDLNQEIEVAKTMVNFTRLTADVNAASVQKCEQTLNELLSAHQQHVPEPEPNLNKFTGHIRYDKNGYVDTYRRIKPLREALELMRAYQTTLNVMHEKALDRHNILLARRDSLNEQAEIQGDIAAMLNLQNAQI